MELWPPAFDLLNNVDSVPAAGDSLCGSESDPDCEEPADAQLRQDVSDQLDRVHVS